MVKGQLYKIIVSQEKCMVHDYGFFDVEEQDKVFLEINNNYIEKETTLDNLYQKGIITNLFYATYKNSEFLDDETWFFVIKNDNKIFSSELKQNEYYVYGDFPCLKTSIKDKILTIIVTAITAFVLFIVVKILMSVFKL